LIRAEHKVNETVGLEHLILASAERHIPVPSEYREPNTLGKLLSDSIDEVLINLVGTRAREATYDYMERNHSTARSEIPGHLDEFLSLFERTFGVAGRKVIGRAIAKKVYSKLDLEFYPIPHFELTDYLERIKTGFAK